MKKFFALIVILLAILAVLLNFVLPVTVANILEEQIANATAANYVDVILSSNPNAKIAVGEIEKIHATADAGKFGDINFKNLPLDGEKLSLDVPEMLFPSKNLTAADRVHKILKHADKIELHSVITEDALRNYIVERENKLESPVIKITPTAINASARAKFLGRNVDFEVSGVLAVVNGDVFFNATHIDTNSILRRVNLDTFVADVKILDSSKLPLGLKYDSVELRDGEVVVTAIRR